MGVYVAIGCKVYKTEMTGMPRTEASPRSVHPTPEEAAKVAALLTEPVAGAEPSTARTANGRDLERHERRMRGR